MNEVREARPVTYGLVALAVSGLWVLVLGWNDFDQWIALAPWMLAAGVVVAFQFRQPMRRVSAKAALPMAIGIGLFCSWLSALVPGLGIYSWAGPYVFVQAWYLTVPLSLFSLWAMRTTDHRLRTRLLPVSVKPNA